MDQEMAVLDSVFNTGKYSDAFNMAQEFKEKCTPNCPQGFLAEYDFYEGNFLMRTGLPDSALQLVNLWLPKLNLANPEEKSKHLALLNLKGQCLRRLGKPGEASETFGKIMEIEPEMDSTLLLGVLMNQSVVDMELQKLHRARVQLGQAMNLAAALDGPKSMKVAFCLNNLGLIANVLGEPEKSAEYLKQSIAIKEVLSGGKHPSLASSYVNLGGLYGEIKQLDQALECFRKGYKIRLATSGKIHPHTVMGEVAIGTLFAEMGQTDSARVYLRAAEANTEIVKTTNPFMATIIVHHIGKGYLMMKDYSSARKFLDQSMSRFGINPFEKIDFSVAPDLRYLHHNLVGYVEVFRDAWEKGAEIYADSMELILEQDLALYAYLQGQRRESGDRRVATELAFPLFEEYLRFVADQEKPSLEKAFELMEFGKARLLSEKLQQAKIPYFAGISDSVIAREMWLDSVIVGLEKQVAGLRQRGEAVGVIPLQEELDQRKLEQEAFLVTLERNHPAYYGIKYVQAPISLAEAQSHLAADEAMVSYFIGDYSIYILVLRKDGGRLKQIPLDFPLREWVGKFRAAMYSHENMAARSEGVAQQHAEDYCQAAYQLYDKLIRPIEADLPLKVCIIPDRSLAFLPFDALLSEMPERVEDFRSHAYLIHRHQFSYSISATLQHQQLQVANSAASQSALIMAPAFSDAGRFKNLHYNAQEAKEIQAVIGGKTLVGGAATSQAFRTMAYDFRILHLASHAKSDDQNGDSSYIAFAASDPASAAPDVLYARDLYGIPLQAEMVVLSACETGLGEWQAGEGLIGLTRACMYAGAKSTVTSLWQVDDGQTAGLIGEFYAGLREGLSKDAALRKAKLHYLQTHRHTHPYYWAAFIPMGNMSPLSFETSTRNVWLGFSFLLVFVIGVLLVRKMKKK